MEKRNTILIADDAKLNRVALGKILGEIYDIIEAADGHEALDILKEKKNQISAIILDLIMPEFSGYDFLKVYHESEQYKEIPVIIATADSNPKTEQECLEYGAWDFISKPYNPGIIRFRVKNAIERSNLQISKELKYRAEYDVLTGIYNKAKFFQVTREMLDEYPKDKFVLFYMDIEKFKMVNAFFGADEGDRLLQHIAGFLKNKAKLKKKMTYGRIRGDIFCVCFNYNRKKEISTYITSVRKMLSEYPLEFDLVMDIGIYLVTDRSLTLTDMYDRANLAASTCKGSYIKRHAYYTEEMLDRIVREQKIVNCMKDALEKEQFELYLQPKYGLYSYNLDGAEVLVRWRDPERGMISPGEFIPVFERNGFITKLDYYVWEKTCQMIRRWLDEGKNPYPVSVNISRVSLYIPNLVDVIGGLVDKYNIPPGLLQLELTESAYTNNPNAIKEMMEKFQKRGFRILMDDFGSGYSSLNVLKDIAVDTLKIDMKFLSDTDNVERSENILASVVRMAKWLNMPVIAEGVERKEQVLFLRSIGCEYVQGYYFARPMPMKDYEELAFSENTHFVDRSSFVDMNEDSLWDTSSQMEIMFSNMLQAVGIYEYEDGYVDIIRVNDAYYDLFGYKDIDNLQLNIEKTFDAPNYEILMQTFQKVVENEDTMECEVKRNLENGREIWINIRLKYVRKVGNRHVIFGSIMDVTAQRDIDRELQNYRAAVSVVEMKEDTILVVDDMEINRVSLISILEGKYRVLEAKNGQEAIDILEENAYQIDAILLDLVMPVMDGMEFLKQKKENPDMAGIPVIIITAEDTAERQIETIEMGAEDYVIKPFIPEIVIHRVGNVINSNRRYHQMLRDYSGTFDTEMARQEEMDELTGLYKHYAAGKLMQNVLSTSEKLQSILFVELGFGEDCGQEERRQLLCAFAERLKKCFRKSDILSRYGENEFVIFIVDTPSVEFVEKRCGTILKDIYLVEKEENCEVNCSIGAAVTKDRQHNVKELLENAATAQKEARQQGNNHYVIYKNEQE